VTTRARVILASGLSCRSTTLITILQINFLLPVQSHHLAQMMGTFIDRDLSCVNEFWILQEKQEIYLYAVAAQRNRNPAVVTLVRVIERGKRPTRSSPDDHRYIARSLVVSLSVESPRLPHRGPSTPLLPHSLSLSLSLFRFPSRSSRFLREQRILD